MSERRVPLHVELGDEVERVVEQTKHAILLGRLRPRERLVEDDFCERFSASRHVVRSAFIKLDQLGLVIRRQNKGVVVRDFEPDELDEIYDMRALLQGEAARRIILPAPAELLQRLHANHARHGEAVAREDLDLICTLDDDFHRTFFEATNNRYLAQMIEQLSIETLVVRSYSISDPALRAAAHEQHGWILAALVANDRALLELLVVDHIWAPLNAYKRANARSTT